MPRFIMALLAALLLGGAPAAAQVTAQVTAQAIIGQPPKSAFEISGWRYQLLGNDVHGYICEAQCNPSSRVSYRLYGADFNLTLEQFREQQASAVKMLQERLPEGSKIEIVAIDEEKTGDGRILKSQRMTTLANGRKEHLISSFVFGGARPLSLISSADDEAAAKANFTQFLAPVMLAVNLRASRR